MVEIIRNSTYINSNTEPEEREGVSNTALDSQEHWLNYPEDWNRPKQAQGCTNDCQAIHDRSLTKRIIRLCRLNNMMGVSHEDYTKLCELDKASVYTWYFDDVFSDHPEYKVDQDVFELQIEETHYSDLTNGAAKLYHESLEDYHNNPKTRLTATELESQRKHYRNMENQWHDCLSRLNEKLKEKQAREKGYEVDGCAVEEQK